MYVYCLRTILQRNNLYKAVCVLIVHFVSQRMMMMKKRVKMMLTNHQKSNKRDDKSLQLSWDRWMGLLTTKAADIVFPFKLTVKHAYWFNYHNIDIHCCDIWLLRKGICWILRTYCRCNQSSNARYIVQENVFQQQSFIIV